MAQRQWYKKGQITQKERVKIYGYLQQWYSHRKIWRILDRDHTSIDREIERNSIDKGWWILEYCPLEAEKKRIERKRKANLTHIILWRDHKQRERLEQLLEEKWESRWPDEMLWRIKVELQTKVISTSTFYRFIREYKPQLQRFLRHKDRWYRARWYKEWRPEFLQEVPLITERPQEINDRKEIWAWEFDTIVSNKKVKWWAVTWVERKSLYLRIMKAKSFEAEVVYSIMRYMLWKEKVSSVTIDNGREFAKIMLLAKILSIRVFRCHPYSSWEKWTNEKHNWFLRRFLPKWCDINEYSDEEIQTIEDKLNHKPRRKLWYKTPYEVYNNTNLTYLR